MLSHATLAHVGALPVLLARGLLPPDVVLLSTTPIKTLSVLMMQAFLAETRVSGGGEGRHSDGRGVRRS